MKNKLYVLTVATPRADLHKYSYSPFLRHCLTFKEANFDVVPIVNLDYTPHLENVDTKFEEAKKHFESLGVKLFTNKTEPSFSKAARTVYTECAKIVNPEENNLFIWLEDDWFFDFLYEKQFQLALNEMFSGRYEDANLILGTTYRYFCGNPSVFRQNLFDQINKLWSEQDKNYDPEFVHFEASARTFEHTEWRQTPPKVIQGGKLFIDGGRTWRRDNQIGKRHRENLEETWFKCPDGSTEGEIVRNAFNK